MRNTFSSALLKEKPNQELRLLCKARGIPQYGDKATLIRRIMDQGDLSNLSDDPVDIVGDDDLVTEEEVQLDYKKMKKYQLVKIMKERKLGGFSGKKKDELVHLQLGLTTWKDRKRKAQTKLSILIHLLC